MRVVRKKGLSTMASHRHLSLVATLVLVLLCVSAVLQSGIASAQNANPTRDLPDAPIQRGETFDVIVTFTASSNDFNAIGLIDNIPTGWAIQADTTWCTPSADYAKDDSPLNQAEYVWFGPYDVGQEFTALYKVTVPIDTEFDTYIFNGQLGYKIASSARIFKDIGGDSNTDVTVTDPSTTPTPAPSPSPTLTPTPVSSLTPTPTSTPSPTLTPTPPSSLTPTPSSTPSPTLTPTPDPSPTLTPTPAPSPTSTPIPATGGGFGPGAWTGIGIGVLVGIMLVVGLVIWIAKRRRIKEA